VTFRIAVWARRNPGLLLALLVVATLAGQPQPQDALSETRRLIAQDQFEQAKTSIAKVMQERADLTDAHYLLGYILFKQHDAKASLAEYTEGAKYRSPSAADLEVVASDYVLLNDYPDADRWFTKALEWNPGDALAWYYLGRVKYNENRFEEALTAFGRCLALDPKNVKAEDNLGLSLQGLGRHVQAEAAFRKALEWQAGAAEKESGPWLDLGSLLVEQERPLDALPFLQEAARLTPDDFRMHRQLGKAYLHLGQFQQAQTALAKAISLAPDNAPLHFMLSQVYQKLGLRDKARAETERYTQLNNN
jgi:tetratricopeptide (TPR) repeat protein